MGNMEIKEDFKNGLTMQDALNAEQQQAAEERELPSDCTYSEGYVKRQPLYACLTCIPNSKDCTQMAGICLACSIQCHEGHELIELGTKRNFRCDCGNSKFPNCNCQLTDSKTATNELNEYNQNFEGKFCNCHRPYMHPDNNVEDDMIQCVICEDWYHCCHLDETINGKDFDGDMICKDCMEKHQFLYNYDKFTYSNENTTSPNAPENINTNSETCSMPAPPNTVNRCTKYWQENWRQYLCKCAKCMDTYADEKTTFLLDKEDTIEFHEESGRFKIPLDLESAMDHDAYQLGMSILNSMDRIPVLNALAEYEDMKTNLFEYLKKFADNKKVVREEDIMEFFGEWTARKKRRTY